MKLNSSDNQFEAAKQSFNVKLNHLFECVLLSKDSCRTGDTSIYLCWSLVTLFCILYLKELHINLSLKLSAHLHVSASQSPQQQYVDGQLLTYLATFLVVLSLSSSVVDKCIYNCSTTSGALKQQGTNWRRLEKVLVDYVYHLQICVVYCSHSLVCRYDVSNFCYCYTVYDCVCVHHVLCSVTVRLYVNSTLNTLSVGLQFSLNVHICNVFDDKKK